MPESPETRKAWVVTVGGVPFDVKLTVLIITATLLPTIDYYHDITALILKSLSLTRLSRILQPQYAYDQVLLYLIAPLFIVLVFFRDKPSQYGLSLGKTREGLIWILVVCPIMAVILWFLVRGSAMQDYYHKAFYGASSSTAFIQSGAAAPRHAPSHLSMLWTSVLVIAPWEFLWRGFFLFGLARVIGPGPAIFIQAIPFALLHLGKPEIETLTTIFGGAGFGFIAWRTQSCLYPMIIHYAILVMTNLVASGAFG